MMCPLGLAQAKEATQQRDEGFAEGFLQAVKQPWKH